MHFRKRILLLLLKKNSAMITVIWTLSATCRPFSCLSLFYFTLFSSEIFRWHIKGPFNAKLAEYVVYKNKLLITCRGGSRIFSRGRRIFEKISVDQIEFPSSPKAVNRPCFDQNFCAEGKNWKIDKVGFPAFIDSFPTSKYFNFPISK